MATSAMPESSATIRRRLDDSDLAEDELRRAPRTGASRVALVLAGKIGSLTQRTLYHFVKAAPSVVALGALTWSEHVINPLKSHGIAVDVFGHAWSPEAEPFVREFWRPTAFVAEPDRSRELENACRARLQRQKLLTYPNSCGRTMSQLLGTTRAMRLKAAHEQRHGFTYAAVVFSRWDVLWLSPTLAELLAARLAAGALDRFWMPDMCVPEEPHAWPESLERADRNFKYEACGGGKPQPSLVPPPAARCGASSRQCYADQQPGARGFFLLDWWLVGPSNLMDGFGEMGDRFDVLTEEVLRLAVTREKVEGARAAGAKPKAGVWIFGHHYWGLTILHGLNATIGWMPVHMGPDYTLARFLGRSKAIDPTPLGGGCTPPASLMTETTWRRAAGPEGVPTPGFAVRPPKPADAPWLEPTPPRRVPLLAEALVAGGAAGRPSPLAGACRGGGAFQNSRTFLCPFAARACAKTAGHRGFLRASRFVGTWMAPDTTALLPSWCKERMLNQGIEVVGPSTNVSKLEPAVRKALAKSDAARRELLRHTSQCAALLRGLYRCARAPYQGNLSLSLATVVAVIAAARDNATADESCAAEGGGPAALPPLKRADLPPSLRQIEAETDAFVAATARGEPGGALLRNATGGEGRYARGWTAALLRWFGIGRRRSRAELV